jgi:uncharacterized protein (DUF58 family)
VSGRRPTARSTLGLAATLILAGLAFDIPSLYEPGVALAVLAGAAAAWVELAASRVGLRRIAPRPSVAEDEAIELGFEVDTGRLPPPLVELRDPLLAEPLAVGPALASRVAFTASWARRGRKRLGPTTATVRDPFVLRQRVIAAEGEGTVLVLPRIEPIEFSADGGGTTGVLGLLVGGASARRAAAAIEVEIDGLRPYREGSPASRIHWPTVARTGDMVELRLDSGAGGRPLVVLDSRAPESEGALDRAVRAAASLAHRLALVAGCGLAIPAAPRILEIDERLRGWELAHARLALVDADGHPPPLRGGRSRGAAVFWVSARPSIATAIARLDASEAFIVSPLDPAATDRAAFTVAGCAGRRLRRRAATPIAAERVA